MEAFLEKYETVKVIDIISNRDDPPSFEKEHMEISVVKDEEGSIYLKVDKKTVTTGANGRPETYFGDYLYAVERDADINKDNWKTFKKFSSRIELKSEWQEGVNF